MATLHSLWWVLALAMYYLSDLYGESTAFLRSEDFRPEKARFFSSLDSVASHTPLPADPLTRTTALFILHMASIAAVGLESSPDSWPALYGRPIYTLRN